MSQAITRHYQLHGIAVTIAADHAPLADALHARLLRFSSEGGGRPAIAFEYTCVPDGAVPSIGRPAGPSRLIYELKSGAAHYFPEVRQLYVEYAGDARMLCDVETGRARLLAGPTAAETVWPAAHPMFTLPLIELLKHRALYSVHAAGLALDGRGLLLAGVSGSGKTTLSLALARAGFDFLGDDLVFLSRASERPRILAFQDTIGLTAETAALLGDVQHVMVRPRPEGWPKRQVRPEALYPMRFAAECDPAVIVFPKVGQREHSVLSPLGSQEAFLELAPNVLLTDPRSSQAHLDALGEVVRASACYRLETGRDFAEMPALFRKLLA